MPVPKSHSRHHQRSHLHSRERRSQPWEWGNQITTIPNNPQTWIKNPNPGIGDSDSPMACLQRVGSEAMNKKMNGDPQIHRNRKRSSQNPWIREKIVSFICMQPISFLVYVLLSGQVTLIRNGYPLLKSAKKAAGFSRTKETKGSEGILMGFLHGLRSPNAQIFQNKVPCLHKIRHNECGPFCIWASEFGYI